MLGGAIGAVTRKRMLVPDDAFVGQKEAKKKLAPTSVVFGGKNSNEKKDTPSGNAAILSVIFSDMTLRFRR
jgi:hypothetical protein